MTFPELYEELKRFDIGTVVTDAENIKAMDLFVQAAWIWENVQTAKIM